MDLRVFQIDLPGQNKLVDPLRVQRRLYEFLKVHPNQVVRLINAQDSEATEEFVRAICFAFELPEFKDNGITEEEALDLYASYATWMSEKKKSTTSSLTSPPCTASPSPQPPTSSLDSTSTLTASDNDNIDRMILPMTR